MTTKPNIEAQSDPGADAPAAQPPAAAPAKVGGAKRRAERIKRRKERAERAKSQKDQRSASILSEGISGHHLRNAMRLARQEGIRATDPFEALEKLRSAKIDPTKPGNPLRQIVERAPRPEGPVAATIAVAPAQQIEADRRSKEIEQIQRTIVDRRRRKLNKLILRLYIWVVVPTLAMLFYFTMVASPLYSTKAEFIVQKSQSGGGLSSLFSGTALGSSQEAVAVQSYILSKEAMLRLDRDHGFIAHFSNPELDFFTGIRPEASQEDAHRLYQRMVKVGYDPSEGVIRLEVKAADPTAVVTFANALVLYAEEVVNNLTARQRADQLRGARESFEAAETDMQAAYRRVLELQETRGVISAEAEVTALMSQITTFELQLRQEQLELETLLDNPSPSTPRVQASQRQIARLQDTIEELRADLTLSDEDSFSLAQVTGELQVAESSLATRQLLFQQSLEQYQSAQRESDRQVGYLALNVSPVEPGAPSYPQPIRNTAMAFLIFAGIYFLLSLTVSVLREQVTS